MGRQTLFPEDELEIGCFVLRGPERLRFDESGVQLQATKHRRKVVGMIRTQVEGSRGGQSAEYEIQKGWGYEPAGMMPTFGPWVGEEDIERGDRMRGEGGENVSGFCVNQPDILNLRGHRSPVDFSQS